MAFLVKARFKRLSYPLNLADMITNSNLHYIILDYIISTGYAPDLPTLSMLLKAPEAEVETGLYELQDYHGVVLHPNQPKIWVIHPFSLAPTNFLVQSKKGEWWGNCTWCALGIAALLQEDVTITTTLGAHTDQIRLHIIDGAVEEKDLLVHFPIPMNRAWDNVIYTCSTMLLFRKEEEIDRWSKRHNIPKGDVQPVTTIWPFAKKWYGNHLNPNWKKWTVAEAKAIFEEFGLTHPIWQLEASGARF